MPCHKCGCRETYCCNIDDAEEDYDMERCAGCGSVFYAMDAAEEDDDGYE